MKGGERHEEEASEERQRQEVLRALQFARRKAKGAVTEISEALTTLDNLIAVMIKR